jgi:hypothetical protein
MIGGILADYAATIGRVFEGREHTVGASDVGQCARRVFWTKMEGDGIYGAARDVNYVDGWGARLRGSTFENEIWLPAMRRRFGDNLLYAGDQQQTLVADMLSATADGLLVKQPRNLLADLGVADIGSSRQVVVECKTIDPRARLDAAKLEHTFQVQIQLGLLHEVTKHHPEFAVISYTDASFWDETTEFVVVRDPKIYAHAKTRAQRIMLAKTAVELPPEGWIAGGAECRYCPFTRACGRERTAVPGINDAVADPQFIAEMAELARAAKWHERDGDAALTHARRLQNEIREKLRAKGLRRIIGDDFRISWSPVKGRPAFDMPAIRAAAAAAGVDISRFETVGDPSDRLVIQLAEPTPELTPKRKPKIGENRQKGWRK